MLMRSDRLRTTFVGALPCGTREAQGVRIEVRQHIKALGCVCGVRETRDEQVERKHVPETDAQNRPAEVASCLKLEHDD